MLYIKKYALLICSFCLIIFTFTSCKIKSKNTLETNFNSFIHNIFINEVQSNTLSLNYSLAYPEKLGIKIDKITLGDFTIESLSNDIVNTENYLKNLNSFNYSKLNNDEKLLYNILTDYFNDSLNYKEYFYYEEPLGPTTGIHSQLPILLAEYSFYSKQDIDNYLNLLPCVKDYFNDISRFEIEKANLGLFMNCDSLNKIIDQCNLFTFQPENNFLIEVFNEKINDFDGLTKNEIDNYKSINKTRVINDLIPAYETLSSTLSQLKGSTTNEQGLYYLPKGKEYYEYLYKTNTGSNKSITDAIDKVEEFIYNYSLKAKSLYLNDITLLDKFVDFKDFPLTDPNIILKDLQNKIYTDFPNITEVNCNIKYVPKSLTNYLSPAMYLVPAIDNYYDNNIYINSDKINSGIYTTMAHEGYPGHLYQNVYFKNNNPYPLRNLLNYPGYTEGWATYVELYSYNIADIDLNLAKFLEYNELILLCIYARVDMGIHYEGWNKETTSKYLSSFAIEESIGIKIYELLLEEPGIYLPYAIGYLEILELKEKTLLSLGDDFILKDFHQHLLDIGPAPFEIIEKELNRRLK